MLKTLCKRPALVATSFLNPRGGRLQELRLYKLYSYTFIWNSLATFSDVGKKKRIGSEFSFIDKS